jgi:type VI secretion system secreted protein Hcp
MAFDSFLKLDGIKGEATADKFKDAIDIYSFSWGASNPISHQGPGLGAGKVSISSFNIMKKTDSSSTSLFQACCNGTHIKKGSLHMRKAGGEQVEFLKYEFEGMMVESVQWSGSSGGDDTPTESVSLAFSKVSITYTAQDKEGKAGTPVVASWDLMKVTK